MQVKSIEKQNKILKDIQIQDFSDELALNNNLVKQQLKVLRRSLDVAWNPKPIIDFQSLGTSPIWNANNSTNSSNSTVQNSTNKANATTNSSIKANTSSNTSIKNNVTTNATTNSSSNNSSTKNNSTATSNITSNATKSNTTNASANSNKTNTSTPSTSSSTQTNSNSNKSSASSTWSVITSINMYDFASTMNNQTVNYDKNGKQIINSAESQSQSSSTTNANLISQVVEPVIEGQNQTAGSSSDSDLQQSTKLILYISIPVGALFIIALTIIYCIMRRRIGIIRRWKKIRKSQEKVHPQFNSTMNKISERTKSKKDYQLDDVTNEEEQMQKNLDISVIMNVDNSQTAIQHAKRIQCKPNIAYLKDQYVEQKSNAMKTIVYHDGISPHAIVNPDVTPQSFIDPKELTRYW
ncbi:UNKNOWN [Stylonychia lemnae]|uniref:Uncharacterized protein n=1 Tax=Stylonychia lemnae TaxID=5949 RepID=A0A078A5I8_STYLE|nr:UNKNOWN [Stylonychia lemnae]|eukprot:CDW77439.1 UNKNOWN [Stylonychia lemnae]